jgi:hypothetical protein
VWASQPILALLRLVLFYFSFYKGRTITFIFKKNKLENSSSTMTKNLASISQNSVIIEVAGKSREMIF